MHAQQAGCCPHPLGSWARGAPRPARWAGNRASAMHETAGARKTPAARPSRPTARRAAHSGRQLAAGARVQSGPTRRWPTPLRPHRATLALLKRWAMPFSGQVALLPGTAVRADGNPARHGPSETPRGWHAATSPPATPAPAPTTQSANKKRPTAPSPATTATRPATRPPAARKSARARPGDARSCGNHPAFLGHQPLSITLQAKKIWRQTLHTTEKCPASQRHGSGTPNGRAARTPRPAPVAHHSPASMRMATSQSSKISSLTIFTRTPRTPGSCSRRAHSLPIRLSSRFTCSAVHSSMMICRTLR